MDKVGVCSTETESTSEERVWRRSKCFESLSSLGSGQVCSPSLPPKSRLHGGRGLQSVCLNLCCCMHHQPQLRIKKKHVGVWVPWEPWEAMDGVRGPKCKKISEPDKVPGQSRCQLSNAIGAAVCRLPGSCRAAGLGPVVVARGSAGGWPGHMDF
jgi:hypothetical protein